MYVKPDYLYPKIKEKEYFEQLVVLKKIDPSGNFFYRLNKSIYGLNEATKNWYEELPHWAKICA